MNKEIPKNKLWETAGQFLNTMIIFLGLALLAWGLRDLRGFFSNPVRSAFAVLVVIQSLSAAWTVYQTPPHFEHEHRFDLARWHAYTFETIFVLAAYGDRRLVLAWAENMPLRWAGVALYLVGLALSFWANISWVRHLQNAGELAMDNPVMIFDGPFKWIRYPAMVALTFYCLGFAVMFRSWTGLVLMLPLIWGIINRINNMEKIFETRYSRNWPIRRHTSKRLIPYLY